MEDDERFKHVASDPRFKNMRQKQKKVQIDERFASMFTDKKFTLKYANDKRGRKNKRSGSEELKKYYRVEGEPSKGNEKEENEEDQEGEDTDSSELSSSSDEPSSDEDEDVEDPNKYNWDLLDEDAPTADDVTRRIAICNFDWDYLNATDIFVLINSFKQPISVKVYMSEFGKQRLENERKNGPKEIIEMPTIEEDYEEDKDLEDLKNKLQVANGPKGISKYQNAFSKNQYEDADEMTPEEREIAERIRVYQINRLKYYYAVIEMDSPESANLVYKELDGMEYEGSSSALDLRFIPDDMSFEEPYVQTECNSMPDLASYEAPVFINTALQQTKVSLTWEDNDHRRKSKLLKSYTMKELEKNDLDAYLASDTDSDDNEGRERELLQDMSDHEGGTDRINKYRMLLKKLEEEEAQKSKVDLEVEWDDQEGSTKSNSEKVNENTDDDVSDEEEEDDGHGDDSDLSDASNVSDEIEDHHDSHDKEDEDSIDDPIESDDERKKKEKKKYKKKKKRINRELEKDPELDLMLMETPDEKGKKHFNYRKITGEEKSRKVKNDDFRFNPEDERFSAVYNSHLYNIDPSDRRFKRTKAYEELAKRKRQKKLDK